MFQFTSCSGSQVTLLLVVEAEELAAGLTPPTLSV